MVHADASADEKSEKVTLSPDQWRDFEEFWRRDVEIYRTKRERAAYRAGLSLAAGVCDLVAVDHGSAKRPTKKSAARYTVAQICGDRIWGIYQQIRREVDRDVDPKSSGVSMKQTPSEE